MTTRTLLLWCFIGLGISIGQAPALGQPAAAGRGGDAASAEDDRERQIAERFVALLERNPRRGTALDRVYGYHVERGTLEAFLKRYRDRVEKDPKDGAAWLIVGLFESQRGRDAAAVAALRKAEAERPSDPLPCYYLGQALVLVGQPEAAAEAFERAIARKPARADMLDVYQALGRSYQRTRRNDKALAVWARLEAQFPDDLRVKEQIADALAEESQLAEALPRYEALAKAVKDRYRQVQYQIEAAEIKVRLGKADAALVDFERLLGQLNPDSWLYREVRRKIEEVFLRNDDLAGLASYYERWIRKTPDDVEALARLGRTLASLGRSAEAREWLQKAVKVAPNRRELRLALIDQLVQEAKFADAAKEYEALSQSDPKNIDLIREWGRLILKDEARPLAERRESVSAVWRRLTEGEKPDPLVVAQVADLFRQAEMRDDAIALYKKAIALAPEASQYREYLGEYYHTLKRRDEALATWAEIAAGPRKDAKNLARLGEVLAGFGYRAEAVAAFSEACRLDDDELDLRLKYADALLQLERPADALTQLAAAEKLATGDDELEAVLQRQIRAYQAENTLSARSDVLRRELDGGADPTAARWLKLARYFEAEQKLADSALAVRKAMDVDPKSVPVRIAAARIFEMAGDLSAASAALRELTVLDRRARSEYLATLAKLEARLGRREAALAAGRDLLAAAPGNVDSYQTFADLCFQLGEIDEGLDALRRSVRANPSDPKVALALADALAEQFRTEEAIELYWRAYEKTAGLEEKLGIVARLAGMYLQQNHFDRLVARLERMRQEPDKQREGSLALAQAHSTAGDLGTARQELERLLSANTRDTQLLGQLSTLSEAEGELAAAVKFQRQLVDLSPTEEALGRLAQLQVQSGDAGEAQATWERLAGSSRDSWRALQAIDSLLAAGKRDAVLSLTEGLIRKNPEHWEALYREGLALSGLGRPDEASRRFQAILAIQVPDDEQSALVKARNRGGSAAPTGAVPATAARARMIPAQTRTAYANTIRGLFGLDPRYARIASTGSNATWSPADFGLARMAALAWMLNEAQNAKSADEFIAKHRAARENAPRDPRPAWDWYYLQLVRQDYVEVYEAAKVLADRFSNDPTALWAYLWSLGQRQRAAGSTSVVRVAPNTPDATPPLPPNEVDRIVATFDALRQRRPDWIDGTVLSNTTAELKRAHRAADEERIYRAAADAVNDVTTLSAVLQVSAQRGDVDGTSRLLDTWERLRRDRSGNQPLGHTGPAYGLMRIFDSLAAAKNHAAIPRLLDRYLLVERRLRLEGKKPRSTSSMTQPGRVRYVLAMSTGSLRFSPVDYPYANAYLDQDSLNLLRSAYEIYTRDDLASDLVSAYGERRDKASSDAERLEANLVLWALDWWSDNLDAATEDLKKALALSKNDPDLGLSLAELHERRDETDEALELVDAIEPLDNTILQRRELAALRLAIATGRTDRARLACDRLFGLRLDSATQTMLAGQMHQLGMHEQAEAVLARARRRAGQNTTALVGLMSEYQRQEKLDKAVQVANQILRRSSGRQALPPGYYSSDESAREQAVRLLARSGKLNDTIERLEAQAERAPTAVAIRQTLADYYRAAGNREKLRATYEAIVKLKPDDARLRFQVAGQLLQAGDAAASLDHFRAAITREPTLLRNDQLSVVQGAYMQARKTEEFAQLLESIDIRAIGDMYNGGQVAINLMRDPKTKERGRTLFRKFWDAFPDQRSYLSRSFLYEDGLWTQPETFELCRQALIPTVLQSHQNPWYGLANSSMSFSSDGRIHGVLTRLLTLAGQQGKSADLAREVESALKDRPGWLAGKAILAIFRAREGKTDEARAELKAIVDNAATMNQYYVHWQIAQELEAATPLADMVLVLYESEFKLQSASGNLSGGISPLTRMIAMHQRAGRLDQARALLRKMGMSTRDYSNYPPEYAATQRVNDIGTRAGQLLELGSTVDAIRAYTEMMAAASTIPADSNYYPNRETASGQARTGLEKALRSVEARTLGPLLESLLEPGGDAKPGRPALDLVLLVQPRELDQATVFSLLEALLAASGAQPEARAKAVARLETLAGRHPDDLAVNIARTLVSLGGGDAGEVDRATRSLAGLVERTPLDPLPSGSKPNARQREQAAAQLGLWLVARACWKVESVRDRGDVFASRALDAARRQTDTHWALAMYREWGQTAFDRGDRAAAEARWATMLEVILASTRESRPPSKPRPSTPATPRPGPRPAPASTKAAIKKVSQVTKTQVVPTAPMAAAVALEAPRQAATSDRFEQATQLALLAAERGMNALSLRAVREALRGGPPTTPLAAQRPNQGMMIMNRADNNHVVGAVAVVVEQQLSSLVDSWRRQGVSPVELYEVLRDCILPASRPGEVFLYSRPLVNQRVYPAFSPTPRSAGLLLVQAAVEAKQVDALRRAIEERRSRPTAEPSASVLLAQLALASSDDVQAKKLLGELRTRLERDTLQNTAELVCHTALPALDTPELAEPAAAVLERAVKNLSGLTAEEPTWSLQCLLARHWFARGENVKGVRALEDALAATERELGQYSAGNFDYVSSRRKQAYLRVANQYAVSGQVDKALELLGRYCDAAATRENYYGGDQTGLNATLIRLVSAMPAAERYDRLNAWTMPTPSRDSVRLMGAYVTFEAPPAPFPTIKILPSCQSGVVSTIGLLFEAAKELGKVDELIGALKEAADRKVEGAETVFLLAEVSRGRVDNVRARLTAWAEELHAAVPPPQDPSQRVTRYTSGGRQVQWADYLLARACLLDPRLAELGEQVSKDATAIGKVGYASQQFTVPLQADVAEARRARAAGKSSPATAESTLVYWDFDSAPRANFIPSSKPSVGWVAHESHVTNVAGRNRIGFAVPLSGSFEFSVDALASAAPSVHFGPTLVHIDSEGRGYVSNSTDSSGSTSQRYTRFVRRDEFNRLTVAVDPNRVRFLVNGHLFHEDSKPPRAAPWLWLGGTQGVIYRNASITGTPQVPRRLDLSDPDDLSAWGTALAGAQIREATGSAKTSLIALPKSTTPPRESDWSFRDGVITGRRTGTAWPRGNAQSALPMIRTLRAGESLTYQFYHVPGAVSVHPALGRLAFLIEPTGVRLHWTIAGTATDDWTGIKPDNAIEDPGHRRGPAQLPLKADDWNSLTLRLEADTVRLTLNGTVVYERPLDPSASRQFSFYHDKYQTEARVRSVALEGNWSELLPGGSGDLFALKGPVDESTRRGNHAVIGEAFLVRDAGGVLERTRNRPPAERYESLSAWVLPGPDHPTFRLQGEFSEVDAPARAAEGPASGSSVEHGGKVQAPALDLVAVAREIGKLDELEQRAASARPDSDLDRRGQLALRFLIAQARARDAEAASMLEALRPLLAKVAADAPDWERWPELVAAASAVDETTPAPALALLDSLASVAVKPGASVPRWQRHARHLRAAARDGRAPRLRAAGGWSPVARGRAETRGLGDPPAFWTVKDGVWTRSPGDLGETLDFACPLRAPFEVGAELASSPECLSQLEYGGLRLGLDAKGTTLELSNAAGKLKDVAIDKGREGPWHALRLVVRDRSLQIRLDGRKVHEQDLAERPSPWLSILGATGTSAMARGVTISGTPVIPREVRLSEAPNLEGWTAACYNERTTGAQSTWEKRGDEITAAALKPEPGQTAMYDGGVPANPVDLYAVTGSATESVLQYRRPLSAGDQLEYEFFYEPGKVAVHPALDRLAFLLEPDGVKVHTMTDAEYDRSGLLPDNATTRPEHRRGPKALPLKPGDWNRVRVALDGDRLTLTLNDAAVYEHPLEKGAAGIVGLFRYADQSEVRVRNVTLRGRWPETLDEALGSSRPSGGSGAP